MAQRLFLVSDKHDTESVMLSLHWNILEKSGNKPDSELDGFRPPAAHVELKIFYSEPGHYFGRITT
jgi:hypothetical protein